MKTLSNKDKKAFADKVSSAIMEKKDMFQYDEKNRVYLINGNAAFIESDSGVIFPFLKSENTDFTKYSDAIIDMPAVPFICNGADLLRPGIVRMGEFSKGDVVIIRDEKNNVKLAVMQALFDWEEAKAMQKGRIAKSLHYFNDTYWKEY